MEYKFDKEMDTLLRQVARSGQVVSTDAFDSHLDADEISMFAENALPEKARSRATKHLAECNNCRSILSNLILLNEETELETVSSAVEEKTVQTAVVPWYKKLFIFPQIAYAMGALALVFSGAIGFLIYQTANQSESFEMAKSSPMMANTNASGPNAGDFEPEFNESASNSMSANIAIDSNSAASADSDGTQMANANSFTPNAPTAKIPSAEKSDLDERKDKEEEASPSENRSKPALMPTSADDRKDRDKNLSVDGSITDDSTMRETAPPPPPSATRPPITTRSSSAPKKKSDEEQTKLAGNSATRRQIGGKTFNRQNGVWIDSDYQQMGNMQLPMTTTVRRGTNEYNKLDKNIRVIAESLEGPVIIVSKNKAYRIQ